MKNSLYQELFIENKQLFRIMKIIVYVCFLCVGNLLAIGSYAQTAHVTIVSNHITIGQVINEIEKQTDYLFVFNVKDINIKRNVKVNAKDKAVNEVLNDIFKDTGIRHAIEGKNIMLINSTDKEKGAQQKDFLVTGIVKDENGEPIIGANIQVVGKSAGTITDMNGRFSISASANSTLQITYIGYQTQTVNIGEQRNINIILQEDNAQLDEVVVVGYGTMKKKDLTGSVTAVKGDELAARRTTQLSTALQGALSGVMVSRDNGAPGSSASIQIRGVTTIGDSSPLVIIDGIPGDINSVNPEDVESMSVLKDAASASIYGSRAAAGVIVITTKRAKSGDVALSYNFEYGWEIPTKLPTYVGAQRYMEMVNATRYNDNPDGGWYQTYTEDEITNWSINNATNPDKYPMTDWGDILLKSSAPRQTHTLSIVGGGKIIRTKASFRYDKTDGLYVNKEYDRFMVRVNNDFNINKYISANLDLNFSRSKALSPNSNPMGAGGRNIPPIYAATWTNGLWGDVKDGENMLAKITDGGTFTNWGTNIGGKLGIDITPVNGLKISAAVAPNFNNVKKKTFVKQIPYTRSEDPNTTVGYMGGYRTTNLTENRNDSHDITTQFFANYAKTLGRHDFSVMIGYEDYYAFWENLDASRDQYQLTSYPYLDLGSEDYRDNGGNAEEYAYRSLFGRMTYSYADRYLIQANLRRDGSSRFASNCRWANFPSVSLGWVISEEKFFKNINMDWFSYLKLRGSWGKLGNERIGAYDDDGNFIYNYYPYQAAIDYSTALFQNSQGIVSSVTTAAQQKYAVRDISWETTESWDIGLDANFLDNRLHFSADYYRKNTKDMLLALEIPHFIGYDNPEVNAGNMHTTGYDIEVGWRDKVGDFTYSISANLSDFTSKMGNLNGTQFLGNQVKMEGSEYNEWYGYVSDGLFLTQEDVDKSPKLNNSVKVGDIKYKDISGPDGVPDGVISPEYDRVLLGGSLPHYMFGLTFNAAYKGWDFGLTLQGVGSQKSQISAAMIEGLRDNWLNFPTILDGNYWSPKNTDEQNATAKYPRLTRTNRDANFCMSDYWLYNGRYIRLKNLSVGYTLPKAWTTKACMNTVRLYVSGSDLFTISNAPKGWDPEVSTEGYPITTSLIFGVSINF